MVTLKWLNAISVYADFIPMFYNTPVNDTLRTIKSNVSTIAFGFNFKVKAEGDGGYSAEVAYSVFRPFLISNIYKDRASLQAKESRNIILDELNFTRGYPQTIHSLDLRIGYISKENEIDAFFKFSCFHNLFRDLGTAKNIFVQVQLGTKINIQKFLEN